MDRRTQWTADRSDPSGADRNRRFELMQASVGWGTKSKARSWAGRFSWPAVVGLALTLAGCLAATAPERKVSLPEPPKEAGQPAPAIREHQRILAAYNGAYDDPRLEALVT